MRYLGQILIFAASLIMAGCGTNGAASYFSPGDSSAVTRPSPGQGIKSTPLDEPPLVTDPVTREIVRAPLLGIGAQPVPESAIITYKGISSD